MSLELFLDNFAADKNVVVKFNIGNISGSPVLLRAHISLDRLLNTLYSLGKPLSDPTTLGPKRVAPDWLYE